jgi:hypothetical protein
MEPMNESFIFCSIVAGLVVYLQDILELLPLSGDE